MGQGGGAGWRLEEGVRQGPIVGMACWRGHHGGAQVEDSPVANARRKREVGAAAGHGHVCERWWWGYGSKLGDKWRWAVLCFLSPASKMGTWSTGSLESVGRRPGR